MGLWKSLVDWLRKASLEKEFWTHSIQNRYVLIDNPIKRIWSPLNWPTSCTKHHSGRRTDIYLDFLHIQGVFLPHKIKQRRHYDNSSSVIFNFFCRKHLAGQTEPYSGPTLACHDCVMESMLSPTFRLNHHVPVFFLFRHNYGESLNLGFPNQATFPFLNQFLPYYETACQLCQDTKTLRHFQCSDLVSHSLFRRVSWGCSVLGSQC